MTTLMGRPDGSSYAKPGVEAQVLPHGGVPSVTTEVFFADYAGTETTPDQAVRVEVVTDGADGKPILLAFARLGAASAERYAA